MITSSEEIIGITEIIDGIEYVINSKKGILNLRGGALVGDIYLWENGSWYYGDSHNNYAHGQGIFYDNITPNGKVFSKYVGEFKNGKFHGKGLLRNCDGEFYNGSFDGGWRHGLGTTYYKDGLIETGNYVFGCPDGWFKYVYSKTKRNVSGYTVFYNLGNIIKYGELL